MSIARLLPLALAVSAPLSALAASTSSSRIFNNGNLVANNDGTTGSAVTAGADHAESHLVPESGTMGAAASVGTTIGKLGDIGRQLGRVVPAGNCPLRHP